MRGPNDIPARLNAYAPTLPPARAVSTVDFIALPATMRHLLRRSALALTVATLAMQGLVWALPQAIPFGARILFLQQDWWWLLASSLLLWLLAWRPPERFGEIFGQLVTAGPRGISRTLVIFVFAVTVVGTFAVHLGHPLVRDELMAIFDAEIFRHGDLMATIAPQWREYAPALLPRFGLPIVDHIAWASAYLPGNSAFRALMSKVAIAEFANPLLAAISVFACHGVARRLWPDRPDAALVAVLLLATSTQVLFMAMTSFAMTGHLLFTLIWLRLVLRDDGWGHVGAIAVGWMATGWHQLAFHPLLAAPFIAHLWWTRRWQLAAAYSLAYAAIGLFWTVYWTLAADVAGVALAGGAQSGVGFLIQRMMELLRDISLGGLALMALNLLRFIAWQNPMLPVLVLVAAYCSRPLPTQLRLAAIGLLLTLVVVLVLLPFQAHGWGYRYMHGYIGVLCLLAAHGYVSLVPDMHVKVAAIWPSFAAACGFVLLVMLPGQALQVHAYVAQHARPLAVIASAAADVVVVDERSMFYGEDFVRNDPYLRNRPLIMNLEQLPAGLIAKLCQRGLEISLFDRDAGAAMGAFLLDNAPLADWPDRRKKALQTSPCLVPLARR